MSLFSHMSNYHWIYPCTKAPNARYTYFLMDYIMVYEQSGVVLNNGLSILNSRRDYGYH